MSYIKADNVLPQEVLELIQEYIDGGYLYIPRKDNNRKSWGETTNSKIWIQKRNLEIYTGYKTGLKIPELARQYFLSEKSIQRIVLQEKRNGL
jgi:Mor family transcriptional regulator